MSATSYYLPSINKSQSKNVDAKWKCAQQIRNERIETARNRASDANISDDDYITTDSGSDLTDDDDDELTW